MGFIFLSVIIAFILQTQLIPVLGLKLNLFLLIVLYYGFLKGPLMGIVVGLAVGLLQDVFSIGILGVSPASFVICGLLAGICRKVFLLRYWIIRVSLVFVLSVIYILIYSSLVNFIFQNGVILILKENLLAESLTNTIVAGILFWIFDRYE